MLLAWSGSGPYKKFLPDSTKFSALLCPEIPLGFLLNIFVLLLRSKHRMLQHLSAQQLPAFGQGAALSLSAEQTLRIITPKMENPGTVSCGTVTSDRGKEKAEERKMYGTVFLLITPPCCKKSSAWRDAPAAGDCTRI